jgi:purine-nucleoside phosphorylase
MSDAIEQLRAFAPEWGMVLGSGLASLAERVQVHGRLFYASVPELPVSHVPGHPGEFVWGEWAGRRVVVARGRVHLYEGHTAQAVTAGIRFVAAAGVQRLILTNAAGTLREEHPPGAWMMLRDHLNLTGASPLTGGPNFVEMSEVYSRRWRAHFQDAARAAGVALCEGVYAGLLGPQYETPAEIRMLRILGADAVGMSTVLEAIAARALGLEVVGFSCLTNWAAGMSAEPLSHEEVLATGREAGEAMERVLVRALRETCKSA